MLKGTLRLQFIKINFLTYLYIRINLKLPHLKNEIA